MQSYIENKNKLHMYHNYPHVTRMSTLTPVTVTYFNLPQKPLRVLL